MKLILVLFCLLLSYNVNAMGSEVDEKSIDLIESSPEIDITMTPQGFEKNFSFNYGVLALKTNYSSANSQRASSSVSLQEQNSDFYLNSELTIQSSQNFDISMTANIYQTPLLSKNTSHLNWLPKNSASSDKLESQYSLIGSYNISSHWKLSGGIILSDVYNSLDNNQSNIKINNVALLKTSYSF